MHYHGNFGYQNIMILMNLNNFMSDSMGGPVVVSSVGMHPCIS